MATCIANSAFDAFRSGDYVKCGQLLEQITASKTAFDVKASHNTLVSDYYRSGCAEPRQLLAKLTVAYDKARERDKKEKSRRRKDEDEKESEVRGEEEDLSILRYNQALLAMQLRQYAQATLILEELFENIEPIDDFLAIKICFLYLDLCLLQREHEQALSILAYLEKPNAFLTVLRSDRPAKLESRSSEDPGGGAEVDSLEAAADTSLALGGGAVPSSTPDATRIAETTEGPLPSLAFGAFLPRHGRAPDTISKAEYRFYCLMYRARLAAAFKNTKAAKKDVKSAIEVHEQELRRAPLLTLHPHTTGDSSAGSSFEVALYEGLRNQQNAIVVSTKAYLEYTRQNARKAMKLMTLCQFNFAESKSCSNDAHEQEGGAAPSSVSRRRGSDDDAEDQVAPTDFHPAQDEACAALFFNNLGCIHFMMQKPNLAAVYFQKALSAQSALLAAPSPSSPAQLGCKSGVVRPGVIATRHWLDRRAEMSYNAGLQMLITERPSCALKCFEQCIPVFRMWPRLWLRIAECCLEMHRISFLASPGGAEELGENPNTCGSSSPGGQTPAAPSAWTQEAARPQRAGLSFLSEMGGGQSQLSWSIQGVGPQRRWLLTTSKHAPIGHLSGGTDGNSSASGMDAGSPAAGPVTTKASDSISGPLIYATMCLRNVLVLTAKTLADRSVNSSASSGEAGAEALLPISTSNGSREAASTKEKEKDKASAAASDQTTTKSPSAGGGKVGSGGRVNAGPRHQARDLLEAEASLLEDSALVKLAFVSLAHRDHSAALRYSRRLLEKNHLLQQGGSWGSSDEPDEVKKQWTLQVQNLPLAAGGKQADNGTRASDMLTAAKFPASIGSTMLAVLYAAEALLLSGRPNGAKFLLGSFVQAGAITKGSESQNLVFQEVERVLSAGVACSGRRSGEAEGIDVGHELTAATAACGGHSPLISVGGLTPPSYVVSFAGGPNALQAAKSREVGRTEAEKEKSAKESVQAAFVSFPSTEFPRLGDSQCMLLTNLAALHIQDGNFREAERCCEKALQAQPRSLASLRTLIYVLLRRGRHAQALARLKQSRLQGSGVTI